MATSRRLSRRALLKASVAGSVLIGFASVGCRDEAREVSEGSHVASPPTDLAGALRSLALAVGPWATADAVTSDNYLARFTQHMAASFRSSESALRSLLQKLPAGAANLDHVPWNTLTQPERDVLTRVLVAIYSNAEVQWSMIGVMPPGWCLGPA